MSQEDLRSKVDEKVKNHSLFGQIIKEFQPKVLNQDKIRRDILKKIEDSGNVQRRIFAYITNFSIRDSDISDPDIAVIEDILSTFGKIDNLDLIINSPGGDATVADKIIYLCRAHTKKQFRVIIPNRAKSAATLIALGADKIVMGVSSELGPIDPQTYISISGIAKLISAQDFIDAFKNLENRIHTARSAGHNIDHLLILLANFNLPFLNKCKRDILYVREIAEKWLSLGMLKTRIDDKRERKQEAKSITQKLTSTAINKSHSKIIDYKAAKRRIGLEIEFLREDDELWKLIWHYYVRAEINLVYSKEPKRKKLIESTIGTLWYQS